MSTASIRIVKKFQYRGADRLWSNRYHFAGTTPPDSAHWTTFADAITAAEKACYRAYASFGSVIVQAVGYAPGSAIPVFTKTYNLDGTATWANAQATPGDVASVVRLATPDRSTKNHPVYLYSYHHSMAFQSTVGPDTLNTDAKNGLSTYHSTWLTGFSDGAVSHQRCRPGTPTLASGILVEPLLSHRDLPR